MSVKKSLIERIYRPVRNYCFRAFRHLPVSRRKIVVLHRNGFADSPKYVVLELLRRDRHARVVWLVDNRHQEVPAPVRRSLYFHIPALYHLATAKVIITTDKGRFPLQKKAGQRVLYIPHGAFGGKYTEGRARTLPERYVQASKWHSSICDLFLSPNTNFSKEMHACYWYDGEIMESGLPRNDIFFSHTEAEDAALKERLGLKRGVRYLLYAPTFRDDVARETYALDMPRLLRALRQKTGEEWKGLVTWHPNFIYTGHPDFSSCDEVIDMTAHPDMQELLLVSDCLVSDYSSTVFDFALMKRPVFLFTVDLEYYRCQRGLYDWFFTVPFPFCHNNDEIVKAVEEFDGEDYRRRLDAFNETYGSVDDGRATARVADRIESWLAQ